ncbi:tereporin-Ca1-like isoform X3 [Mytilus californianus]|uniref:tereporin-Ca1-like isoform X3 n=1 Tax=Mytilus californianus TaxID=6549 RepID=UPI0022484CB5|nr:tereporin-Ca1-like isoform X3 [Mytilus californianus]
MATNRHNRFNNRNSIEENESSDSDETNMGNNSNEHTSKGRVTWNSHKMKSMRDSTRLGGSLHGTSLSTLMAYTHYSIVVGIEITNWTKYRLTKPKSKTYSGYISTPAVSVRPGHKEAMIMHKHGYTTTGSSGIVSWLIQHKERRITIVWNSPYFSSNSMGICLTTVGNDTHNDSWFNIISKKQQDEKLKYEFSTFSDTSSEMMIEDDDFQIFGSMGTSSKPEVKITLRPTMTHDLSYTGPP